MTVRYRAEDFFISLDFRLWIGSVRLHEPSMNLHTHDFWELASVISGRGYHILEGEEFELAPGDVFVINHEIAHGFSGSEDLEITNVLFDPEAILHPSPETSRLPGFHALFFFEPFYRQTGHFRSCMQLTESEMSEHKRMLDMMATEFRDRPPAYQSVMTSVFNLMVVNLSRLHSLHEERGESGRIMRLSRVVSHMQNHFYEPILLDELLEIVRMSKNHFLRVFRQCYGTSPIDYLIRLRLEKSCGLLEHSGKNITEIAFEAGFNDSNYYTRQFSRTYGMSPRAYRYQFRESA